MRRAHASGKRGPAFDLAAWDRDVAAIRAGRAHADALAALRSLAAESVRVEVRDGRVGIGDDRAARRDAILDAAAREGADKFEIIRAWQADRR